MLWIDLHRWMKLDGGKRLNLKPRLLIIHGSPDLTYDYISIMNSTFAAQKLEIPVDVCILHDVDSLFLQQAAHITHGIYRKINHLDHFLYSLMVFIIKD
jgi:transcription initiation factor TFIIH subunit 3